MKKDDDEDEKNMLPIRMLCEGVPVIALIIVIFKFFGA